MTVMITEAEIPYVEVLIMRESTTSIVYFVFLF